MYYPNERSELELRDTANDLDFVCDCIHDVLSDISMSDACSTPIGIRCPIPLSRATNLRSAVLWGSDSTLMSVLPDAQQH